MRTPFKFLDSFTVRDKDVFFGREKEVDALYAMVFKTPLTLLYGLSGTGKTSIIQCGLASRFEGPDWLPFYIRRKQDINQSLKKTLLEALDDSTPGSLPDIIAALFDDYLRPVYLIFDQFEELFILGKPEEQKEFATSIRKILDMKLPCRIILVVREEYLGRLYPIEKEIPSLFDFRLRIETMTNARVHEVLDKSFNKFNISLEKPRVKLLKAIIDNVSAGKSGIQLTYLQVYLDMLYQEDYQRDYGNKERGDELPKLTFTHQEIKDFGKIDDVLDKFLREQVTVQQYSLEKQHPELPSDAVRLVLDAFVTEDGTKRPVSLKLEEGTLKPEPVFLELLPLNVIQVLSEILLSLEKSRLIRLSENSIELAHDSLASLIDQQRTTEQRQLNEVKKRIAAAFLENEKSGVFLNEQQLLSMEELLPKIKLEPQLNAFVNLCKNRIEVQKNEAKQEQERKLKEAQQQTEQERELREQAERAIEQVKKLTKIAKHYFANNLALKSKECEDKGTAFRLLEFASKISRDHPLVLHELTHRFYFHGKTTHFFPNAHAGRVISAALSPDGKTLITGSVDKNVVLWDLKEPGIPKPLKGHIWWVNSVAFSHDGSKIVTSSRDGSVKTWSVRHGVEMLTLKGKADENFFFAEFSPDDKKILTVSWDDDLTVWDSTSGSKLLSFTLQQEGISSACFSPDGKTVACSFFNGNCILLDVDTGHTVQIFDTQLKNISCLVFSKDGARIAMASNDRKAKVGSLVVFSVNDPQQRFKVDNATGLINSLTFSPDSNQVMAATDDGYVKIWEYSKDEPIVKLGPFDKGVRKAKYAADGKRFILCFTEGNASIWDAEKFILMQDLKGHTEPVWDASLSPNGKIAVTASLDNTLMVHDVSLSSTVKVLPENGHSVFHVSFDKNGSRMACATGDGVVRIWNTKSASLIFKQKLHKDVVYCVNFSPNGNDIVTTSRDGKAKITNLKDFNSEVIWDDHRKPGFVVKYDPDGKRILLVSSLNELFIWGVDAHKNVNYFIKHPVVSKIKDADFSPDGSKIITGAEDLMAIIWDSRNQNEIFQLKGLTDGVEGVLFSPDGNKILTFSKDKTAKVWDANTGSLQFSTSEHDEPIVMAFFHQRAPEIITVTNNKALTWCYDSEALISAINQTYDFPYLTPGQMTEYELEELLDFTGITAGELAVSQNPMWLRSLAEFYSLKASTTGNKSSQEAYQDKADRLFAFEKKLLKQEITDNEKKLGPYHPDTAVSYTHLAKVLQDEGDYESARPLFEKAVIANKKSFGHSHPKKAESYSDLAVLLKTQGDFEGAKRYFEMALKSDEQYFGPDHPVTALRYSNLAGVLRSMGEFNTAKDLYQKAMTSGEKNFGPSHPEAVMRYTNLAMVLQNLGEYEEARLLLEKALHAAEKNFGAGHLTTAESRSNLAAVLWKLQDYHGAKVQLENARFVFKNQLGDEHPSTTAAENLLKQLDDASAGKV